MRRSSIWDALIGHTRLAPLEEEEFKVGGGCICPALTSAGSELIYVYELENKET